MARQSKGPRGRAHPAQSIKSLLVLAVVALVSTTTQAQDQNVRATMLDQVKQAETQMKTEFGPKVFLGRAEFDGPHGHETIGQAWTRGSIHKRRSHSRPRWRIWTPSNI
jgi:hypothetical protein